MEVGDMVKWSWALGTDWERTQFQGLVVNSILAKTDYEKVRVLVVATDDGHILDVRDDEASLKVICESR
jgi:hypothetical protein